MTRGDDPEQRLAAALRAQATGAGRIGGPPPPPGPRTTRRSVEEPPRTGIRTALLLALLGGLLLGVALAALSLWAPGALPPLG